MDIGVALPTMARGFTRATFVDWCRGIDAGPFSSVSAGERITFHNTDFLVSNAAAAALTERVRVFANLAVAPLHAIPVLAKQLATLDILAGGRLTLGVGIGGREDDYRAAGSPFARRHERLDQAVAELRQLWRGEVPFEGADPVGPAPVQQNGPPILAGALGPKAMRRAAAWADGISSFSITAGAGEMVAANRLARQTWTDAGRTDPPRLVSGCFYLLGGVDAAQQLRTFTYDYLRIFGDDFARAFADEIDLTSADRLRRAIGDAEAAGCDEFILVPGTVDLGCLEQTVAALDRR
ncbi:MAG: hypothetical protein QOG64_2689 [Acidimicrobiaceae bacterium]|jgi:alkanesulfonate monooxygenase SsuD/methylene tetrahydromethanopterin reductase-like flavin-dependent oxidoreductase (luciferase family)|nr:hypothetical protein [Acidimicrobiaceae bacterium]